MWAFAILEIGHSQLWFLLFRGMFSMEQRWSIENGLSCLVWLVLHSVLVYKIQHNKTIRRCWNSRVMKYPISHIQWLIQHQMHYNKILKILLRQWNSTKYVKNVPPEEAIIVKRALGLILDHILSILFGIVWCFDCV